MVGLMVGPSRTAGLRLMVEMTVGTRWYPGLSRYVDSQGNISRDHALPRQMVRLVLVQIPCDNHIYIWWVK